MPRPETAWDFTWYFQGVLKNWTEAVSGEVAPDQIGVHLGANEYELVFETVAPAPYLPAMLLYSLPLSAAGLGANGLFYNTDPDTAISSGPYILSEWLPDQSATAIRNEAYTGTLPALLDELRVVLTSPDNFFTMYQANEIDYTLSPPPAALTIMMSDEETAKEVFSGVGDFPTYYVFFDVTKEPWTDIKVRQAWSHAVDRDALATSVLGPSGVPAYSWLAPGFPANNTEGLKDIQAYDPEKAKSLLAEAGFPDGDGFPKQTLMLRAPSPLEQTAAAAIAAMISENLNIEIELVSQDSAGYIAALNAKPTQIELGFIRYGMDFFDPYNMLSVWLTGGRHSWSNADYDAAVHAAAEFLGDPEERLEHVQGRREDPGRGCAGSLCLPRQRSAVHQTVGGRRLHQAGRQWHHRHSLAWFHDHEHGAGGDVHRGHRPGAVDGAGSTQLSARRTVANGASIRSTPHLRSAACCVPIAEDSMNRLACCARSRQN